MPEVRELFDVPGLSSTSEAFRRELIHVADRQGLQPTFLAAVISFESRFKPDEPNIAGSGAMGLIQFMPDTARAMGTTVDQLAQMTALEQLPYVEEYYDKAIAQHGPVKTIEDTYLAVLSPACIGKPSDTKMPCRVGKPVWQRPAGGCSKPLKGPYCQNRGLDIDGDGFITAFEATEHVRKIIADAASKPRVLVDMSGLPTKPGAVPLSHAGVGGTLLPFAAGAVAGFYAVDFLTAIIVAPRTRKRKRRPRGRTRRG